MNYRIPQLLQHYDIIAARPTTEKTLKQACESLDVDLVSIDLTTRFPTHFRFSTFAGAIARGIKIEICYGPGILASDATAKRNLISNAVQLIRVTRGRGLILSSEARSALGIRAPSDVMNLASIWGLGQDRGKEGLTKLPRSVVETARMKRTSYRGVVDVVYGGEKPVEEPAMKSKAPQANADPQKKRKAGNLGDTQVSQSGEKISNRERKRREKRAKLEASQDMGGESGKGEHIT
jgi:ribonuclease P/MRP protein subunit RPP1